jgi:hypothetical protein
MLRPVRAVADPPSMAPYFDCHPHPAIDTDGDGVLDTFTGSVTEQVCFEVAPRENDVAPGLVGRDQGFVVWLDFTSSGGVRFDRRAAIFVVPPPLPPPH